MVEIIPKPIKRIPLWQNILFYFSITILIASVAIYFILGNFLKKSSAELANLENEVSKGKTVDEQNLENRILGYQKKIEDFSRLIKNYQQASSILNFIQESAHPKVWFSLVDFDINENSAAIEGKVDNFQILGQQFLIFKTNPLVKKINLSNVLIGKDGVIEFSLKFLLDPQLFISQNTK